MGSVDFTTRRHKHRLITIFVTMKSRSIISVGVIIGQADNVALTVMQSVPVHPNKGYITSAVKDTDRCIKPR